MDNNSQINTLAKVLIILFSISIASSYFLSEFASSNFSLWK